MFVEKEIRNFTLSNGSLVQIVIDSPFFYGYVNGTRFRTNEQPASYSGSYLSSYLHRNLGLDDRVQVKYKNYYCSLFMPDKKKRVEIEVTPLEEKRICVTAKVNNAKVYRKIEQKPFRLFRDIQDLEIYRQLRKEYLNCVRQHNFLSFNTEKIASMFDYELVQVFRMSYEILREPNEPYKEYMKNILRLMYEDSCKRGFSQLVGQPSNAKVIKHDVDVPDIKVSSVENNRDTKVSPVESNRDVQISSVASNKDVQASPVANNKDVVSSMPDEKKSDDIDDDTNKDEYPLKRDKKPSFADDRKVISFEEYKRLRANGVKVDYTHYKVEYKSHEEYEERVRLLYEDHMKLNAERHRQELSQAVEQPIDTGVVKHDIDVPDIKASSDEDFGDDYASDEDYGDYSLEEDRDSASSDDNEKENLGDYSSDDDYGDYSADDDEDFGDYDSDDDDYGDGYFSDSDDKDYSSEEDVSNDYSNKEDSLDVSDEEKVNDLDDNTEEDVSDDDYSSDDEDYGDYASDDDGYGDGYFSDSDDEDNYGDDDYFSDDEEYGDDYGDSSLDDEEDYGDYDVSEEDSPSDDSDVSSDNDKGEDLGEQCSSDEGGDSSDENDSSNDVDSDLGDEYSSDDSESFEDEYLSDDEDLSDEDSGIEDDYGDGYASDDEDFGDNY